MSNVVDEIGSEYFEATSSARFNGSSINHMLSYFLSSSSCAHFQSDAISKFSFFDH